MRSLLTRLQVDAMHVCLICGDMVREVLSHAGHGHTPWG